MLCKTLIIIGFLSYANAGSPLSDEALAIAEAVNNLGFNLYKEQCKTSDNVLLSPWSVENVFGLSYMGAVDNTAKEMASTLQFPDNKEQVARAFQELTSSLQVPENSNMTLSNVNKLYLAKTAKIKDNFIQTGKKSFNAEVETIDLAAADQAARTMNDFVASKTNDKIKDLVPASALGPLAKMVIINAMYFNAFWKTQFSKTRKMNFYRSPTDKKSVTGMMVHDKFPYAYDSDLDAEILGLPYTNEDYFLMIVLPTLNGGIQTLEEKLPINLNKISSQLRPITIKVQIPKFKLEESIDLKDVLEKLGIHDAFSDAANFHEMTDTPSLHISAAMQKNFIDVNEKGTEAASGSAVIHGVRSSRELLFIANRPFMFAFMHKPSNTALMLGRVKDL